MYAILAQTYQFKAGLVLAEEDWSRRVLCKKKQGKAHVWKSTIDEQAELTTVPLTKSTTKPHRFALLRFSLYAYGGNDYAP